MGVLAGLMKDKVFEYFEEICNIPHGSGNVEQISNYLVDFAKSRGLYVRQDENYNVVIKKPGNRAAANAKPVIIQGHMDMVTVKTDDCNKNMEEEGLDLYIEDGYVKARNTSLGADDGIAVAYALAILDSDEYSHPPIEVIITVDEEIGLLGANNFEPSDIDGRILLNIDSEEEGEFLAGCAGGALVVSTFDGTKTSVLGASLEISVSGLTSGHSGVDIIYQRANANVVMGRILGRVHEDYIFNIAEINGGDKDNSIAPWAKATIVVAADDVNEIKRMIEEYSEIIKNEYAVSDPNMNVEVLAKEATIQYQGFDMKTTNSVILALGLIPDGVIKMSYDIEGLVQTSLNLGVLRTKEDTVEFSYFVRSSVNSEQDYMVSRIITCVELLGGDYVIPSKYSAWEYNRDSKIRDIMVELYEKLFNKNAVVRTIHAGVECGILAEKIPGLDCVSFGPEIIDIHTVKERLNIESTKRYWELLIKLLDKLSK